MSCTKAYGDFSTVAAAAARYEFFGGNKVALVCYGFYIRDAI